MELLQVQQPNISISAGTETNHNTRAKEKINPFIEANTKEVSLSHLKNDTITPVFAKCNSQAIAHQEFIEMAQLAVEEVFPNEEINKPEIRCSHIIRGRQSHAIHKPVKELSPEDETLYYERMMFAIQIPSIFDTVNGHHLSLSVGGVRCFNHSNLYGKKSIEKVKAFIAFKVQVCTNLCIMTSGYQDEIRVSDGFELKDRLVELYQNFNSHQSIKKLENLSNYALTEQQFAQLIGRSKLYNFLPNNQKLDIPNLALNDRQMSMVAKDYYQDKNFSKAENGSINLWDMYNLCTNAVKSSYIDNFTNKNVNAYEFVSSIAGAIENKETHWFLN